MRSGCIRSGDRGTGRLDRWPRGRGQIPGGAGGVVFDSSGFGVSRDAAAGVALYASAANMRGVVAEAREAVDMVEVAKQDGRLPKDAKVEAKTLEKIGVSSPKAEAMAQSVVMNVAAKVRAFDETVLEGFGNNGGEEFLSYQMKSEALVVDGGEEWAKWSTKMNERLAKVQNQDGSWSGHHCITSPTFCTATAVSCFTPIEMSSGCASLVRWRPSEVDRGGVPTAAACSMWRARCGRTCGIVVVVASACRRFVLQRTVRSAAIGPGDDAVRVVRIAREWPRTA
ncbi:MAG: hypothetical protein ABIP94_03725 [Planctomycetota bacterium]